MVKPAVPYFIAIALNLLLIRWSHRSNADKISRGIMVSTFLFMILLFLIKVKI
ncbi:hypothetical protein MUY27_11620 [Mucilaginibacter sp. RS28]|uniref:Uncharacterized protein n=1 Tax=Mucilaginibacter straminoryzae TaxID=2932774 RepID=A0A9X1X654_9SPHI|nr:hypothetical protein [Mucilaginibacter straminoryzae]MCJ8210358.1 hypothetical protein [Mucilaginibacter straminoryzae]